jgi:4-hydroxy-tetrahydrodipicolinate synthase
VIPILFTPFGADNEILFDDVARQLDFLVEQGIQTVGVGFGSEVQRLTRQELGELVGFVARHSQGSLSVIGNANLAGVQAGIDEIEFMASSGTHAVMIRPSGLAGVPQSDLLEAFQVVARSGSMPLIIQDAPQHTGVDLSADTYASLIKSTPQVIGLKIEPTVPLPKIEAVIARLKNHDPQVIGGRGGLCVVQELRRGAVGTMPGPAFPEIFSSILRMHQEGQMKAANELHCRLLPLIAMTSGSMDAFLFQQKYILKKRGVFRSTRLRGPHATVDPRLQGEIDEMLDIIGFAEMLKQVSDRHDTGQSQSAETSKGSWSRATEATL